MTPAQAKKLRRANQRRAAAEASVVLKQRLHDVRDQIEPAARHWRKSREAVHRLRVAARRAVAAIDLLDPLLPRHRSHRMRRLLQRIRRACDAARDHDVLIARMKSHASSKQRAALLRHLKSERRKEQRPIVAIHRDLLRSGRLERRTKKLTDRVRWGRHHPSQPEPSYRSFIRERLKLPAARLHRSLGGRSNVNGRLDISGKAFHRLRIRGKRLRYALELAGDALPRRRRARLEAMLRQLQDHLGAINDSSMARKLLMKCLTDAKLPLAAEFKRLLAAEETAHKMAITHFVQWKAGQRLDNVRFFSIQRSSIRRRAK